MNTYRNSEKGQAIVFLVIGLIVFLGFVALAIDGGMAYADRRYAQNSSDSSSLAGGGSLALEMENRGILYTNWNCNSSNMVAAMAVGRQAAINRAAANGFSIADGATVNGVTTQCGETNYGYIDRWVDVTVNVSDTTTTSFAHLLFPDALKIQVEAVTRVRPRQPLAFGNAIVALNPAGCSGQQNGAGFHGSGETRVVGGGIWSNGCLRGDGGTTIVVEPPHNVNYVGQYNGGGNFTPPPQQQPYTLPPESYHVPLPDCTGRWFNSNYLTNPANQPLGPGLYCINGDLRVNAQDEMIGHDITIYVPNGEVRINGGALVQIDAPPVDYVGQAIPGILIYLPPSNHNPVELAGNGESFFEGTILAPGSDVDASGTADVDAFRAQIIGWNVEMGGNAATNVEFNEQQQYSKPTSLELKK